MERDRTATSTTTHTAGPGEDDLVAALWARDVRVFPKVRAQRVLSDVELIRGLMTSAEARFQLAVIPLLLRQPTCDAAVVEVLATLSPPQRLTLTFYYQAATYLQCLERDQLAADHPLRDHFSAELSLPAASHVADQPGQLERALLDTARLQARATGLDLNWAEAYWTAARFALRKARHAAAPDRSQPSH